MKNQGKQGFNPSIHPPIVNTGKFTAKGRWLSRAITLIAGLHVMAGSPAYFIMKPVRILNIARRMCFSISSYDGIRTRKHERCLD
jgi:hypothetical protein